MHPYDIKHLKAYLEGNYPEEEARKINRWLIAHCDSVPYDRLMEELWNEMSAPQNGVKSREAYEKFCTTIGREPRKAARHRLSVAAKWAFRAAAALVLPLLMATLYYREQSARPVKWIEEYVAYGQTKQIVLSDRSVVWLNAGSKLVYPEKFYGRLRQVFVEGEAYLDVVKNTGKPFYVSAGKVNIRVLGTKFNVKSYIEENRTEVSLVEGMIRLTAEDPRVEGEYTLHPGDGLSFDHTTGFIAPYRFSAREYTSWSDPGAGIYFRNLTLDDIVRQLERKFDVQIVIRDERLRAERYFASFVNGESLHDILSSLNVNGKLRIQRQQDVIDIYPYSN